MPLSEPTSSINWPAIPAVVTPAPTDEYLTEQGGETKTTTRLQVHTLETGEYIALPMGAFGALSLRFGDGDTGFYELLDDFLAVVCGNDVIGGFSSGLGWQCALGATFLNEIASSTNPVILPAGNFPGTGLGGGTQDALSLICDENEAIRAENPDTLAAGETSLWLYDDDNGTLEQVTVGAADSGGAGFKVLRIPN